MCLWNKDMQNSFRFYILFQSLFWCVFYCSNSSSWNSMWVFLFIILVHVTLSLYWTYSLIRMYFFVWLAAELCKIRFSLRKLQVKQLEMWVINNQSLSYVLVILVLGMQFLKEGIHATSSDLWSFLIVTFSFEAKEIPQLFLGSNKFSDIYGGSNFSNSYSRRNATNTELDLSSHLLLLVNICCIVEEKIIIKQRHLLVLYYG